MTIRILSVCVLLLASAPFSFAQNAKMSVEDLMKFRNIYNSSISAGGNWVAYDVRPDRGDGESVFISSDGKNSHLVVRGSGATVNNSETHGAATLKRPLLTELNAKKGEKYVDSLIVLDLKNGSKLGYASVKKWMFSEDGRWIAIHQALADSVSKKMKKSKKAFGSPVILRDLKFGKDRQIESVHQMSFDSLGRFFAYSVADTSGKDNSLHLKLLLRNADVDSVIHRKKNALYASLAWHEKSNSLAFTFAEQDKEGIISKATLQTWFPESANGTPQTVSSASLPDKWFIPLQNNLSWSVDRERLFFGMLPSSRFDAETAKKDTSKWTNPYDVSKILQEKEMDVWHQDDPKIKPHEKVSWKSDARNFIVGVVSTTDGNWKPLGDETVDRVVFNNSKTALGIANTPYEKAVTWDYFRRDLYHIDLEKGKRTKIVTGIRDSGELSPAGKFIVYFHNNDYHLFEVASGKTRNLTQNLGVPFQDEDHDYPIEPDGYGIAGWTKNDETVFIYDKFDVWMIPTSGGEARRLTEGKGREENTIFRFVNVDSRKKFYDSKETILLTGYKDLEKSNGFYEARADKPGFKALLVDDKKFTFRGKARDKDVVIFTQEKYNEFPDLWTSNLNFKKPRKLTNEGSQTEKFNWGKAELVSWRNLDGREMQGVLIKPNNFQEGKQYPVVVYYYRFFSQRLHEFPATAVNHRPSFPFYVSDEYLIFLPDIRFEIGTPGLAATKSLVPGVLKLVEMGVADPKRIGLHGHSWSGYQTAFIVTQTDIFAAAVAGAPVSNMTSAYGGVRWTSGLSRQFQYEQSQSRIGGSLWEYPERYIENSPLFFADRINTPLLLQHGDADGAVPWYQSIEMYMAMRRLGKPSIFLQYHGEDHHLAKYPNKVDYALKMKHYFDHYLKDVEAEEWITNGEPYAPSKK